MRQLYLGSGTQDVRLNLAMTNRHGLVAGATGTGKSVTLQVLAEAFSAEGVPVFIADVKGDLSGLAAPGGEPSAVARALRLGMKYYHPVDFPVRFWDVYGRFGDCMQTTVTKMGPSMVSRLLDVNPTQAGVLQVAFAAAQDLSVEITSLRALRGVLTYCLDNKSEVARRYGNVTPATVATIQRAMLALEMEGADALFGEHSFTTTDLIRVHDDGRGVINLLTAVRLVQSPKTYAMFLLWLLTNLYQTLPEVGDTATPRLIFFFDEAHLLFTECPKPLLVKIEQTVRLVRSKGVGVYFATQSPLDIPNSVLAQLGNRVQHALRMFTPQDQRLVRAVAQTFRQNPDVDTERVLPNLKVGEALVSVLDDDGVPTPVERIFIRPPRSQIGPIEMTPRPQPTPIIVRAPEPQQSEDNDDSLLAFAAGFFLGRR